MPQVPTRFRAPAFPLVTVDPYISIWSMADHLYDDHPRHWTTSIMPMVGMVSIDGSVYRFCGRLASEAPSWFFERDGESMPQVDCEVSLLSTRYVFEASGVRLTVSFTTPLLLDDLDVLSRPASYIDFDLAATDGAAHRVSLYFDISARVAVNTADQRVIWGTRDLGTGMRSVFVGTREQNVLGRRGDDLRIDWGWAHVAAPQAQTLTVAGARAAREAFRRAEAVASIKVGEHGEGLAASEPVLAAVWELGTLRDERLRRFAVIAYEDLASIEYFGKRLFAYCYRDGKSFDDMLRAATAEHEALIARCDAFGATLCEEARAAGGDAYADICTIAYRQAIAAHKLVAGPDGEVLFFSKECFSNGCIATVDVTYPSVPLFLLFQPELVKGMMRPIFRYADTAEWTVDYAPHDAGTYPRANGQVYGVRLGVIDETRQMPVEECGNMLILAAVVARLEGSPAFAEEHWAVLRKWAGYLEAKGFDPANQLCTDDFAGHLAHNANLSVKTIVALAAFADLCGQTGASSDARRFGDLAGSLADRWQTSAVDGDHYRLAFDRPGSWSLKYNLAWDVLLGYGLFSAEIYRREIACYKARSNRYGVPLDSRSSFTKADWLVWAACLADNDRDFQELVQPLWRFLSETPIRTPFSDWYGTIDGLERSFHHRSVVGGVFMKVLKRRMLHG